ncbi:FHA domain-containing protein [Arthrobacter dokdonensis]|uniref:FHA domain-containing protein n=1 Tax=Arthrobacter dokdonellae TaxID=2211210 RepID=UPI001D131169|nr:FHA domain-containing protein [Arthrobacter dokdonellae]
MADTTYRTGHWLGIVRSGAVIVLEAGTDPAAVGKLWEYLGGTTPTIHGVLSAVTEIFGTDLTGMPPFGILVASDRLHVILRGGMSLAVETGGAQDGVSGRDVTTWSERSLALPDSLVLTLDGGLPEEGAAPGLPVGEAVVLMSELRRGVPAGTGAVSGSDEGAPIQAANDAGPDEAALAVAVAPTGMDSAAPEASAVPPLDAALPGTPFGSPAGGLGSVAAAGLAEPTGDREAVGDEADAVRGTGAADDAGDEEAGDEPVDGIDSLDHAAVGVEGAGAHPDDDDYAGFAMAADAEWSAELDEPSGSDHPAIHDETDGLHDDFRVEADEPHGDVHDAVTDAGTWGGHDDVQLESGAGDVRGSESTAAFDDAAGPAGGAPANEDSLLGATEPHSVEDEAGRYDGNGHDVPKDARGPVAANIPPQPQLPPAIGRPSVEQPGGEQPAAGSEWEEQEAQDGAVAGGDAPGGDALGGETAPGGEASGGEAPGGKAAPAWQPPSSLLTDPVPGGDGSAERAPAASQTAADNSDGTAHGTNDHDFNDTDADGSVESELDGRTVMANEFTGSDGSGSGAENGASGAGAGPATAPLESRPATGPMVLARLCPAGHANPPSRSHCSDCGAAIDSEPREVGRPRLGRMHISTGEVLDLDHSLVIGRHPSVSRVLGGVMPRLVQVDSGKGDISRSHVEVRLEGWDVLLVDLEATNGTVLVREGQVPRRLDQGEQVLLRNGDIADLGDGVSLVFEGLL